MATALLERTGMPGKSALITVIPPTVLNGPVNCGLKGRGSPCRWPAWHNRPPRIVSPKAKAAAAAARQWQRRSLLWRRRVLLMTQEFPANRRIINICRAVGGREEAASVMGTEEDGAPATSTSTFTTSSSSSSVGGGRVEEEKGAEEEVKAVLFDMDGVLCDSEDRSRQAAVAVFADMLGLEVTAEDFIPFMGTGEANFLGGVARKYNVPDFDTDKAKQKFFDIYISKFATPNSGLGYPGALVLIEECRAAGIKCAVASSADRIKVDANLAAAALPQSNFDAIVSADKFARLKPSPDIFLAAAKELGVEPSQCVVIEDAVAGVQAARAAGMRCIAVTTTLGESQLAAASPSLIKKDISSISLSEILSLKEDQNGGGANGGLTGAQQQQQQQQLNGGGFLEAEMKLPMGLQTTRRDVLRYTSLLLASASVYICITRVKAMSYASPQAIINAIRQAFRLPGRSDIEGESRVARFRGYLEDLEARGGGMEVPDFPPRLEWLNTAAPLRLHKELKGKVVLLDFWTYCCINCMHVLPDLAFLETKYKGQPLAVVGVHSAKFDNEKDLGAIRNAVLRYDVTHPVVNDSEMALWRALGVSAWPTIAVVSPGGRLIGLLSGENHREDLDELITAAFEYYGERGSLDNYSPLPEFLEKNKDSRVVSTPLKFPGKLAVDGANGRLFISDSNNHRIVVTDLNGKFLRQIGGAGGEGFRDGTFESAAFNRPQGVAYSSSRDILYVADTENHALREVNFVDESVRTLAGNGSKGSDYTGGRRGPEQALNSPWDVSVDEAAAAVYVAMAGQHQIWRHDINTGNTQRFSGDGYERNRNGRDGASSSFAQPSGISIAPAGDRMFVADSESSSLRTVDLRTGGSTLCAGGDASFAENLFQFGDRDGPGSRALLQHPLAVACALDGTVFVADSYNHKIKAYDPSTGSLRTLAGSGQAGFRDGEGAAVQLSEPGGLALGPDGVLFVADTNNSVIRLMDVSKVTTTTTTGAVVPVRTLELSGVPPPLPDSDGDDGDNPTATEDVRAGAKKKKKRLRQRSAPEAEVVRLSAVAAAVGTLQLNITIPRDYHFTKDAKSRLDVESEPEGAIAFRLASNDLMTSGQSATATIAFSRTPESAAAAIATARVGCKIYYCQQDEVCLYKEVLFEVPLAGSQDQSIGASSLASSSSSSSSAETSATIPLAFTVVPKRPASTAFIS